MDSKRVYRIIGYNVLYVVGSLLMYYPFDMKSTGLSFCAVGLTLINVYYFLEWKEDAQKGEFVQKYKAVHQRSLSKATINYKETYTVSSSILAMMIFGSIICFSGIGMFYEKSIFGVFVLFIGGKFLLIPFTEKTTIKLAPNGIYMSDYQFVFINDIQEINFKRLLGKSKCKMFLKIKDPALYGLKDSHIAVPIGADMRQVERLIAVVKKLYSNTRIFQGI
ncbi:hypothetical protein [Sphingobacterium sp. BIGb0165]|uniref:hypothetical protein n=1 Tax=Sphingobacterium sp. BIGb0165 TaxID=2940615 RepID=UPI0021674CD1|nr:hypothetical protein [Sphingobacterium sp. BIGb0165]MCS4226189.1 hypothetical protein [Sphingobacterium sp. BIGb0165]